MLRAGSEITSSMDVNLQDDCKQALASKGAIDRYGVLLAQDRASEVAVGGVQCFRRLRLSKLGQCLSDVISAKLPINSLLSARLKRIPSIRRKIERSVRRQAPTRLCRIDDIVGIRVVCNSSYDAAEYSAHLHAASQSRIKDYVANPQWTGYRAIHHVMSISHEMPSGSETNFTFEAQVRTYFQHQWAIWSESYGETTKEGSALEEVQQHLLKLSQAIERWEASNPQQTQTQMSAASEELLIAIVNRKAGLSSSVEIYRHYEIRKAFDALFYIESTLQEDSDVLLLAGRSGQANLGRLLKQTHPTYFRKVVVPEKWQPVME